MLHGAATILALSAAAASPAPDTGWDGLPGDESRRGFIESVHCLAVVQTQEAERGTAIKGISRHRSGSCPHCSLFEGAE